VLPDEPVIAGPWAHEVILEELEEPGDVDLRSIDIRERCGYLVSALTHLHMDLAGISDHVPSRRKLEAMCSEKSERVSTLLKAMARVMESMGNG
jgi:hypothetical protein